MPDNKILSSLENQNKLDSGEAQLLSIFLVYKGGFVLTDDKAVAKFCVKNHHPFINALLVPKIFRYAGFLNRTDCCTYMEKLYSLGRYSDKIIAFAKDCGQKELEPFLPKTKETK